MYGNDSLLCLGKRDSNWIRRIPGVCNDILFQGFSSGFLGTG